MTRKADVLKKMKKAIARSRIRTHAHKRGPERPIPRDSYTLSGALDHSAILTFMQ